MLKTEGKKKSKDWSK